MPNGAKASRHSGGIRPPSYEIALLCLGGKTNLAFDGRIADGDEPPWLTVRAPDGEVDAVTIAISINSRAHRIGRKLPDALPSSQAPHRFLDHGANAWEMVGDWNSLFGDSPFFC